MRAKKERTVKRILTEEGTGIIRFLKDWTLPVAIAMGTGIYLLFYWTPALDAIGERLGPVIDTLFPVTVFFTLFATFCKVDFHQMLPHRWHIGILGAQLLLVSANVGIIFWVRGDMEQKVLWEAILTCVIGPSASAAPVVTGKLGGNISTMSAFTVISSFASALLIPAVFPLLEQTVHMDFGSAFLMILNRVAIVLVLPLLLGWLVQHTLPSLHHRIAAMPNLSFYCWAFSLTITSGITIKNIIHSHASPRLLLLIALFTLTLCFVQFLIGRGIGRRLGEEINSGQALFQKNTALSIWVAYMYLNPVASVGAGCYVLWQNMINSMELWAHRRRAVPVVGQSVSGPHVSPRKHGRGTPRAH